MRAIRMSWAGFSTALVGVFFGGGLHVNAWAQTVPTDLLDLSIEELFDANVVSEADRAETENRWHLSYICRFRVRRILFGYSQCFLR